MFAIIGFIGHMNKKKQKLVLVSTFMRSSLLQGDAHADGATEIPHGGHAEAVAWERFSPGVSRIV